VKLNLEILKAKCKHSVTLYYTVYTLCRLCYTVYTLNSAIHGVVPLKKATKNQLIPWKRNKSKLSESAWSSTVITLHRLPANGRIPDFDHISRNFSNGTYAIVARGDSNKPSSMRITMPNAK